MIKRVDLVPASGLLSVYRKKSNPALRWDVSIFKENAYICQDMFDALVQLDQAVTQQKGTLFITDLGRTWQLQDQRRKDFENGSKPVYAAIPGGSFHQAGKAVDFSTQELNFQGVDKEKWLKKLWDLAKPLGFRPIIPAPDLRKSECWHFDMPGKDWQKAYADKDLSTKDALDYNLVAKACILDCGLWNPAETEEKVIKMFVHAQLIRLGKYEIGEIDGILGPKCQKAIQELGCLGTSPLAVANMLIKL
jgi:hypothetical protein